MLHKTHRHKKVFKNYLKKHWITLLVTAIAVIAAATFLYIYNNNQSAQIRENQTAAALKTQQTNAYVTKTLADKAAKIKQLAQIAAAKAAAEQSKNATVATATTIDSSLCNAAAVHNNPANIDVLVNKKHCLMPLSFTPNDLVPIYGSFLLSAKAAGSFETMYSAAMSAGQAFQVTSSYRSYASQISTYNYWVSTSGKTGADTYSARPGYSEHQTGLAVDLEAGSCALSCFGGSSQYGWLQQHAADYGFIQRYPAGQQAITGYETEEWHYRFVGVAIAKDMKAKGIATLEQYWNIGGGDY
jgi:D-alanyl-D-alanine carboxypeptidase